MGNLNQFYFMGRVTKAPALRDDADEGRVADLSVSAGTSGRRGRGLSFVAYGPQAEMAQALKVGTAVILRGQLRQEGEGAGALVARVQAIQVLSEDQPRAGGGGGEGAPEGEAGAGRTTRRRRRGRGRGRKPEGGAPEEGEAPKPSEGGAEDGEAAPPPPPRPEPKPLPPPTPVAKPSDPAPPPSGDVKADMPF